MARGTSIFYASGRQSVKRKAETQARANALMIICSRRDLPTSNGVMRRRAIMWRAPKYRFTNQHARHARCRTSRMKT